MLEQCEWLGQKSWKLENDRIRCVVLSSPGAKIVSLFDKNKEKEWLVPTMRNPEEVEIGSVFTEQSLGGWDEMLPTINQCVWNGITLPDHGELWQRKWTLSDTDNSLTLYKNCACFPYRITRSISFIEENSLKLDYSLINFSDEDLPFLWAAHPQFAATPSTRIELPDDVKQVINVLNEDPILGSEGSIHPWPGRNALDRLRMNSYPECRKVYILPDIHINRAALKDDSLHCGLDILWDASILPYCGIWVDEGTCHSLPVFAIEPSSAYYDDPIRGASFGCLPMIRGKETVCWSLILTLTSSEEIL